MTPLPAEASEGSRMDDQLPWESGEAKTHAGDK